MGSIGGVMFAGAAVVLGLGGSIPCCGCLTNLVLWVSALSTGAIAGFLGALLGDWERIPYDRGIGTGTLLGLRAGVIAGLMGGVVYTLVAGLARLGLVAVPAGSDDAQQGDAAMGAAMITAIDFVLNIGLAPLVAGGAGAFWGVIIGAIRRRKTNDTAAADAAEKRPFRPGYVTVLYAISILTTLVLIVATSLMRSGPVESGPAGGVGIAVAPPTGTGSGGSGGEEDPNEIIDRELGSTTVATGMEGEALSPDSSDASRELREGRSRYPARYAFDGTNDTAWAVRDAVAGADWVEARWRRPVTIDRVVLTTGYEKVHRRSGDLFYANAHLATFRLETDEGIGLPVEVGPDQRSAEVSVGARTRRLRLIVDRVHPGARWQDLSISEIQIFGSR